MYQEIGKWRLRIEEPELVSFEIIYELEEFLTTLWRKAILETVDSPWWAITHLKIPSPLIRVDMAVVSNPADVKKSIYEVEVRPGGLGIMLSLIPSEEVFRWREIFRICQGLINIESSIQDDELAAQILEIPFSSAIPPNVSGPYWIRSNKRDGWLIGFEKISLVPLRLDGDKRYLVRLGLAEILEKDNLDNIDWSEPFVVKPLIGARMEGVEIYTPNSRHDEFGAGGSTKSRIRRVILSSSEPYIIQRFIFPQRMSIDGIWGWKIWRLFFGWYDERYTFIGGLWNWRPNLRVHGSSDAVFGLLKVGY